MHMTSDQIGFVLIGRNEGERLRRCLKSVVAQGTRIVYVDSNSGDGSPDLAREFGVDVVELDPSRPLSAARSRNAGFAHLVQTYPDLPYVQFLDGDCELVSGWLTSAIDYLEAHPPVAIVCGRRRELFPEQTVYNKLCDIEWNTPVGEATACGGDFAVRTEVFQQVGGFNPALIGGEEPEMCVRIRNQGWQIFRLDADMTIHDADMHQFRQWWRRSQRAGHAYAEGAWMHGTGSQRHWLRESISNWVWGLGWPLLLVALAWPTQGWSLLGFLSYPAQMLKVFVRMQRDRQLSTQDAATYAFFCILMKFPLVVGQLQFLLNRIRGQQTKLLEYKTSEASQ